MEGNRNTPHAVDPRNGQDDNQIVEQELSTQLTLEDESDHIFGDYSCITDTQELEQQNVIINPDPDSMDYRG